MIRRIVRNLIKPHLIPGKAIGKIQRVYAGFRYDENEFITEQEKKFSKIGLDYSSTHSELEAIYEKDSRLKVDMTSCHHNLFVALSKKYKFNKILEIGTHSGSGATLLSILFPDAKISTIDLPDNHPVFLDTYNRSSSKERLCFIKNRDTLLSNRNNIEFKQINSLELIFSDEVFDLIWVDGAHGYPVVTIDIINSLRLINKGGFVVCDDVYKRVRKSDEMYSSIASYRTIEELSGANLINYSLILKRTIKPWGHKILRKYIAVLQKKY